jgi:hypothetical protein
MSIYWCISARRCTLCISFYLSLLLIYRHVFRLECTSWDGIKRAGNMLVFSIQKILLLSDRVLRKLLVVASGTKWHCVPQGSGVDSEDNDVSIECMWCHPHMQSVIELKKTINVKLRSKLNSDCTIGFLTIKTSNKIPLDYILTKNFICIF